MKSTSSKKPARATPKKTKTPARIIRRAAATNPCDEQNGDLSCIGGFPTNTPWPATGGPWVRVIAENQTTGVMEPQYADLSTLCPGAILSSLRVVAAPCAPCGGSAPADLVTEQPNS